MFIDEKGKLFGKINLLDCIIVLIVIIALVFGGWYFVFRKGGGGEKLTVRYTIEVVQKEPEYFQYIIPGETVTSSESKQEMGKIISCETKPTRVLSQDNENMTLTFSEVEGMLDGYIVVELEADIDYPDFKSGDETVKLGKQVAYRSNSAAIHGFIVGIDYDTEKLGGMKE